MANVTWKLSRRANAQLPLVIVLALAVVLVLLGKAQNSVFDRARARMMDWMAPALATVHAPAAAFGRWVGSLDEVFHVYQENLALKGEIARLRQWRDVAVVMEGRVKRYQALLHAVPDPGIRSVLAHVVGRADRPFLQTLILDGGTRNDIKPGQAVIDASGMIGRVYLAGQRTSWVILLTDLNSHVPVSVAGAAGKEVRAMMNGDASAMPVLDTLSQVVSLHGGDAVISSGDGGLLPPGLAIGTVVATSGGYRVALLADPAASEDVEVLAFSKPPETPPSVTAAQLPAIAAGLPPAAGAPPAPPVAQVPAPVAIKPAASVKPGVAAPTKSVPTPPAAQATAPADEDR